MVTDNEKTGWLALPDEKREWSEFADSLIERTKYYAAGIDWTNESHRMEIQVRATCADQATVKDLHLAAMILLAKWPDAFVGNERSLEKYHQRLLRFFSEMDFQPSDGHDNRHYLHMHAEAPLNEQEAVRLLRSPFDN